MQGLVGDGPVFADAIHTLLSSTVTMSLADACLVRMAEQHTTFPILTLDSHFRIYRKSGRAVIPHALATLSRSAYLRAAIYYYTGV